MNRQSVSPVVTMSIGGRGGGSATLTEAGERAVQSFWSLRDDLKEFLARRSPHLEL